MASKQVAEKSSNTVHIYSTLANPQKFTKWGRFDPSNHDMLPVAEREVLIKGGAGVATKNLLTPLGVHTAISVDDYDAIKDLEHFKKFVDSGHIRVERKLAADIEVIVGDMNPRDAGGPITPADYEAVSKDGTSAIPVELEKAGTGWVANQLTNR